MNPYRILRYCNDIKAVVRGRVPQRVVRRMVYKRAFKAAGWFCRLIGVTR